VEFDKAEFLRKKMAEKAAAAGQSEWLMNCVKKNNCWSFFLLKKLRKVFENGK
jgi:hypothetical protein